MKNFWEYISKHPLWSAIIAAGIIKVIGWIFDWSLTWNLFDFIYSIHLPNWLSATFVVNVLSIIASISGIYASILAIRSYGRKHESRRETFKKFEKRFEKAKTDDEKFSLLDEVTNKMSAVIKDYEKATSDNSAARLNEVIETDTEPIPPKKHPYAYDLENEFKNEMTAGRTIDIKIPIVPANIKPISLEEVLGGTWEKQTYLNDGKPSVKPLITINNSKWYEEHQHKYNIENFIINDQLDKLSFTQVSLDGKYKIIVVLNKKSDSKWTGKEGQYNKVELEKFSNDRILPNQEKEVKDIGDYFSGVWQANFEIHGKPYVRRITVKENPMGKWQWFEDNIYQFDIIQFSDTEKLQVEPNAVMLNFIKHKPDTNIKCRYKIQAPDFISGTEDNPRFTQIGISFQKLS